MSLASYPFIRVMALMIDQYGVPLRAVRMPRGALGKGQDRALEGAAVTSRPHLALAFFLLFIAYEAPEGVGRLLQSFAWTAGLMLLFHAVAFGVGRALGYRTGFGAYALGGGRGAGRVLLVALLLALVLKPALTLLAATAGLFHTAPVAPLTPVALMGTAAWLALSTFIPSLAEDIVARGFWYRAWPVAGRGVRYVLFSACVFVLTHVYRLQNGPLEWLMLFCSGLAFAAAVARTGTLWGAVGLHWGWNLSNGLLDLLVDVSPAAQWVRPVTSALTGLMLLAAVRLLPSRADAEGSGAARAPEGVPMNSSNATWQL
jgi:uncharacterized protein